MGNDIARQFAHLPDAEAAAAIARHIETFWDPRMRRALEALVAAGDDSLDPLLVDAVGRLAARPRTPKSDSPYLTGGAGSSRSMPPYGQTPTRRQGRARASRLMPARRPSCSCAREGGRAPLHRTAARRRRSWRCDPQYRCPERTGFRDLLRPRAPGRRRRCAGERSLGDPRGKQGHHTDGAEDDEGDPDVAAVAVALAGLGRDPYQHVAGRQEHPNPCPMWLAMENLAVALDCVVTDMMLPFLAGLGTTTVRAQHIP